MKLGDIKDKLMPMLDDAHWAENALDTEDNQFTRRAYIRSLFALIEGSVWVLKQTVLHAPVKQGRVKRLTAAEYALLSDKTFDLKSNGQPKEQVKFLKLPENLRFTFSAVEKYFGITIDLEVGKASWNKFLEAQQVRNRITHPKTVSDFEVSNSEISACKEACSWFNELIAAFFHGIVQSPTSGTGGNA